MLYSVTNHKELPLFKSVFETNLSNFKSLYFPVNLSSAATKSRSPCVRSKKALPSVRGDGNPHPTLRLIADRAKSGSTPSSRGDPYKLGLVVEGGGMRGAVTAGMLMALYDLGLQRVFDSAYGSSAGAINLTYFLTGQREGVDVYAERLTNKAFIDPARIWRRDGWVLDLGFLLEDVMQGAVPLDWEGVLRHEIPLKAAASCISSLKPVMLDGFRDAGDLLTCLRASANVPVIAGSPMPLRGHLLVDAAVFEPVPFPMALRDGCTHVLALCSRPDPSRQPRGGLLASPVRRAVRGLVRRAVLSPAYMRPAWDARLKQDIVRGMEVDDVLSSSLEEGAAEGDGASVFPVFPGPPAAFAPLCTDPTVVAAGVRDGAEAVLATFDSVL